MNDWHYHRPELAEQYLAILATGITSHVGYIADRRMGKTLFMLQDLAPLAYKKKFIPVYVSLWANVNAPHESLITALEEANKLLTTKFQLSKLLQTKISRVSVGNDMLGRMDLEFASTAEVAQSSSIAKIELLISELEKKAKDKKILLMIDEIQHLGTSPQFDAFTYALRTLLDKRQGNVKSIFTGSSRHYMNMLLNESRSAFFHFVELLPFPDLDDGFIEFLRNKLITEHKIKLPKHDLGKAFVQLDNNPFWMMKLVVHMTMFKTSLDEALEHINALIEAAEGYEKMAQQLKLADKVILLAIDEGASLFAKETLKLVETKTNVKGTNANIQRSLSRLMEMNIVVLVSRGKYTVSKKGFVTYLKNHNLITK